jgi:hypothetical protein
MLFVTSFLGFVGAAPAAKRWMVATLMFASMMNGISAGKMVWLVTSHDTALTQALIDLENGNPI